MKKLFLAGLLACSLNYAHATAYNFTTTSLTTLDGSYYYNWYIGSGLTALQNDLNASGSYISSASLTFNNFTFTAAGSAVSAASGGAYKGYLWTQLLPGKPWTTSYSASAKTDSDVATDGFTTGLLINQDKFVNTFTTPITLTDTFGTQALLDLLTTDIKSGFIDIGIDPDCHYYDSSIVLNITTDTRTNHISVPDSTTTFGLLGISMLGLAMVRRTFSVI